MTHPTTAPRVRRWSALLALLAAATAAMAFASAASAATFTPTDGPGLQAAIVAVNNNTDPSNTIVLGKIDYLPLSPMTITSTRPLEITGPGSAGDDGPTGQPAAVDGTDVVPLQSDLFTVAPGANVTFKGFTITSSSDIGFAVLRISGTAEVDNMALSGNNGVQIGVTASGNATVNNTLVGDGNSNGVTNQGGTLVLNNTTIANNGQGGLFETGTTRVNNTVIAFNDIQGLGTHDCSAHPTSTVASLDSDGTCGVALPSMDPLLGPTVGGFGGPTPVEALSAGSPAIGAGNSAICPTADQRFYTRSGACDIGSFQVNATRDTTLPTCVVTATITGPPKQQQVTATDTGSGLGPDAISNVSIDNGTVAFTPFNPTSRNGLVLTATKTDQALLTHWSFTANDWAGNSKDCR